MRRKQSISGTTFIVQIIHLTWHKKSRGGPGAVQRNRVPTALPLPFKRVIQERSQRLLIHRSDWTDADNFSEAVTRKRVMTNLEKDFNFDCATIHCGEESVELTWKWEEGRTGVPARRDLGRSGRTRICKAKLNEWVRARWNYRQSAWEGGWWYETFTVNAGVTTEALIPADFFLKSAPADECIQLARLW